MRAALDAPWWRWIGLNQHPGGITVVRWDDTGESRLVTFDDVGHL